MSYLEKIEERIDSYKKITDIKLIKGLPIICIFDGSSFSKFVKGLEKPYDIRLTNLMIECTKFIVEYTNARIGYCGSDEITIVLYEDDIDSQTIYNGRITKLLSELPAKLSVRFNKLLPKYLPEKIDEEPIFDAKLWNVPTLEEACNCFWLREESVFRNAITMASLKYYSSKQLESKNGKVKQEMLFQKGINFNDYITDFKRGTYIQKRKRFIKYTSEEINKLPMKHEARKNPDLEIERSEIRIIDMPIFSKIKNKVGVIFYGEDPIVSSTVEI